MKKLLLSVYFLLFTFYFSYAQTVIYTEDFETTYPGWQLNTTDLGGDNSLSDNQWIVNNEYVSGGFFTNTPTEPAGIPNNPTGYYLHIYSDVAFGIDGSLNDIFDAAGQNSYFAMDSVLHTVGYTSVSLSFWWICQGNSNNAYGEVYYRTSAAGTWTALNNPLTSQPKFNLHGSSWVQATITDTAFDNKSYLQFGFRFRHASSGNDPAFGVDHVVVNGTSTPPPPPPVANFSYSPTTGEGCEGDCFDFTSTTTGNPTSLHWTFPGGNPATSTSATPHVCYATANVYNVTLIASNTGGADTFMMANAITIHPTPAQPTISVNGNVLSNNITGVTYQWLINNAPISGATASTYTITQSGYYQVHVTNIYGCQNTSDSVFVNYIVGINEPLSNNSIFISPNPVKDILNLKSEILKSATISVYDLTGRKIFSTQTDASTINYQLSTINYNTGIYFVELKGKNGIATKKFVKQ